MLSHLRGVIQWKVVMAFIAGMLTAAILFCLLPATAVPDTACPVKYPGNGLINNSFENKILPG
jgi:Na+-transporting NADH:ubiquinone oxidoreductase subunit NqrB